MASNSLSAAISHSRGDVHLSRLAVVSFADRFRRFLGRFPNVPRVPLEETMMLAEALRLIRVFHDMKQKDLAERLEISNSHLSEIEAGKKHPSIDLINRYSAEFGIPSSSILFFAENLDEPDGSVDAKAKKVRRAISRKVINFLKLIEERTADA